MLFHYLLPAQYRPDRLRFEKITIEQGLPHNYVRAATQDAKGFMWFGTNYGLARFDGYDFKVFQPDAVKPNSIAHKSIDVVYCDSKGNLWISFSSGGIGKMVLSTEKFSYYATDSSNKVLLSNEFSNFYEDNHRNLWAVTPSGIFRYHPQTDQFVCGVCGNSFAAGGRINSFADDGHGNIWFTQGNTIRILNKQNFSLSTYASLSKNIITSSYNFTFVYSKKKGEVWIGTTNRGLLCYDAQTGNSKSLLANAINLAGLYIDRQGNIYAASNTPEYKIYACKKEHIDSNLFEVHPLFIGKSPGSWINFVEDNFGNIYISSSVGLAKFNFNSGLEPIESNILIPNTISNNYIERLFIDVTDNLWIAPQRQGLNKADLRQKPFKLYSAVHKSISDIAKDRNVTSVFEDSKGYVWIGKAANGISIYNKKTGEYHDFFTNSPQPVTAIFEDKNGYFWLGFDVLRKVKFTPGDNNHDEIKPSLTVVSEHTVYGTKRIASDKEANLWFATVDGLIELDHAKGTFINHSILYDSLRNNTGFYRTVFVDKNGTIWAGSNSGGLTRYKKSEKKFEHYLHKPENPFSISNNTVYAILQDETGNLWLGTRQGLNKFNPQTEKFEHSAINYQTSKRSIFSVLPDSAGNLWLSSDIGIIKYNKQSYVCSFYGPADGFRNNEFSTTGSFMSPAGEIFFGGTEGLVSFMPSEIKANPIHARPVITNFLVYNKVISPGDSLHKRVLFNKQVWETDEITLKHHEADFIIEFSALHYSAPEKITYFYKLDGFNPQWIETGSNRRFATYTGLQPGKYVFMLKATNNDGVMCPTDNEVRLSIIVTPPFWQTLWFRIILAIVALFFVVLFIRLRVRSLRMANIHLDKKVKERTHQLEQANQFLEQRSRDLEEANAILEERQEEINLQKEEILSQYESLESSNLLLKQQQDQILKQNLELDKHRNKLQYLVEERTKELEKALIKAEESDKLKSSFLTNMSHEIRTPMNAIIGFSSLLKDKSLQDKHDEFISLIEANGLMLINLINNIFELSNIESQHITLCKINKKLSPVLNNLYGLHKYEAQHKNLVLKLNIDAIDDDFCMYFDEGLLKQVFTNLLSNAFKFTEKGTVEFGIQKIDNTVTFFVKDSGVGIPDGIGDLVFDRFYKIEGDINQLYRGTGLGLAICKGLVTLWQGEIWYETKKDIGTTFYFTHPLETIDEQNNQIISTKPVINLHDKCILIAEDEESNYKLLESYLKRTKAKLIWARNGREAVKLAREHKPGLILMDIKMPIMDGIEAAKQIREIMPSVPVIAQTAYAMKNEIADILKSGIEYYIVKPIKLDDLIELIRKTIFNGPHLEH
ncbi:MAG: response regulator [Bacteroidales bacterium]|nr:response regulator [Bacteroidales bacterium]